MLVHTLHHSDCIFSITPKQLGEKGSAQIYTEAPGHWSEESWHPSLKGFHVEHTTPACIKTMLGQHVSRPIWCWSASIWMNMREAHMVMRSKKKCVLIYTCQVWRMKTDEDSPQNTIPTVKRGVESSWFGPYSELSQGQKGWAMVVSPSKSHRTSWRVQASFLTWAQQKTFAVSESSTLPSNSPKTRKIWKGGAALHVSSSRSTSNTSSCNKMQIHDLKIKLWFPTVFLIQSLSRSVPAMKMRDISFLYKRKL